MKQTKKETKLFYICNFFKYLLSIVLTLIIYFSFIYCYRTNTLSYIVVFACNTCVIYFCFIIFIKRIY